MKSTAVQPPSAVAAARVDGALQVVDALPRAAFAAGSFGNDGPAFLWPGWDSVAAVERVKPAFEALRQAHAAIP